MEYGRLVVLGYSSYRVAMAPRRPRSPDAPPQSFGLADPELAAAEQAEAAAAPSHAAVAAPLRRASARPAPVTTHANGGQVHRRKSLGQLWEPLGDQNAHYILQRRARANGVRLRRFHHFAPLAEADVSASASSSSTSSSKKEASSRALKTITKRMMHAIEEEHEDDESTVATPTVPPFLMCVPMNDKDASASVTEFHADDTSDLFQIGRMPCPQNDFVIPGPRVGASGTISRFAARLLCSREPPFECRLFAGGFDASRRMSTAGHALKFCVGCHKWMKRVPADHSCVAKTLLSPPAAADQQPATDNQINVLQHPVVLADDSGAEVVLDHVEADISSAPALPLDGLTKNGVRVWLPEHKQWFEVSVNGNMYAIEGRSAGERAEVAAAGPRPPPASLSRVRNSAFNRPTTGADGRPPVLTNGAIIDLGGVQLQFQTLHGPMHEVAESNNSSADDEAADVVSPMVFGRGSVVVASVAAQLENLNVQCPVQLHPLRFTRPEPGEVDVPREQIPHVFPACGHVFGYDPRIARSKTCPLCRAPGNLVQLLLKENSQLQSAAERHAIPECVLNPCGHAISTKLAAHYAALLMPNGRAICPFCAVHLDLQTPYSRLYLYSESDD